MLFAFFCDYNDYIRIIVIVITFCQADSFAGSDLDNLKKGDKKRGQATFFPSQIKRFLNPANSD